MATLKIKVENGFFVSTNGCYICFVEPTHVLANGWDCYIRDDGTIECYAIREYSDGEHSMKYIICPNGFAKLTLKLPNKKVKTIKKGFVTRNGHKPSDGLLGLASGYIDERYAYFRDKVFQEFLDKFGITAVSHEDPNQIFSGRSCYTASGYAYQRVFSDDTDGSEYEELIENLEHGCNSNIHDGIVEHHVISATWTIVERREDYKTTNNYSRILYTLEKDVMKLEKELEDFQSKRIF